MASDFQLCMNCFEPLPQDAREGDPCPHCGDVAATPNDPQYLQVGTTLSERYTVGRLREAGGDAAVYAGYDTVLKSPIVIREFFPDTLCGRGELDDLVPIAGGEATYEEYLNKFLAHARKVARSRDLPASIPVYDIFRENNTAYTVSERCEGVTLAAFLEERGGRLSWEEARPLFVPMMASLISLHQAGVYHLGLSPDTLIVGDDGKLHIGSFAIPEARQADGELSPQLTSGYAAPEQYTVGTPCGAATDVYGLSAVIFRTLVGSPPPDGETRPRANTDLIVPADAAGALPSHVAAALFGGLQPALDKRINTVAALRDRLSAAPAVAALLDDESETPAAPLPEPPVIEEDEEDEEEPRRSWRGLYITLGVIGFLVLIALGAWLLLDKLFPGRLNPGDDTTPTGTSITSGSITITEQTQPVEPDMMASVPNVIGQDYNDLRGHYVDNRAILLEGLKYSDTVPAGIVISQRPEADTEVSITEPIRVIISAGSEYVQVPNLTGWKQEHAQAYLEALGFTVAIDVVPVSAQEAGYVDGTSPAPGNSLARGSEVRLRVSSMTTTESTTETTTAEPTTTTTTTTTAAPTTTTTTTAPAPITTTEPIETEPTDPEPTDPEPTDPEPTDPEPTDPDIPEE